MQITLLT